MMWTNICVVGVILQLKVPPLLVDTSQRTVPAFTEMSDWRRGWLEPRSWLLQAWYVRGRWGSERTWCCAFAVTKRTSTLNFPLFSNYEIMLFLMACPSHMPLIPALDVRLCLERRSLMGMYGWRITNNNRSLNSCFNPTTLNPKPQHTQLGDASAADSLAPDKMMRLRCSLPVGTGQPIRRLFCTQGCTIQSPDWLSVWVHWTPRR